MNPLEIVGERTEKREPRFPLVPFDRLVPSAEASYLVKGLIPRAGLVVVWGPPKCGKSFWTFDLALHVALGWHYRGRRVRKGVIVYAALEGAAGFHARAEAFRQRFLAEAADQVPLHLMPAPLALAADYTDLIASVRAQLGDTRPAIIVIDTLNRSLNGSESKDEDMAAFIRAADSIRAAFNCAVIIVHHCGVDSSRPRGHTSLTGAADCQIAVKRDNAENIIATVEWMKDGPEGAVITSRLEAVEVGPDEDGDPVTSCVVVEADATTAPRSDAIEKPLPKGAKIALRTLQEAIADAGEVPPASNHIPPGVSAVSVKMWRKYCYSRGISESEKERARQQAFKRAHEALVSQGVVAVWDDMAWISR